MTTSRLRRAAPPSARTLLLAALLFLALAAPLVANAALCGRQAGGALCANTQCCSARGECGSDWAHCGKGCQSGACVPLAGPATASAPASTTSQTTSKTSTGGSTTSGGSSSTTTATTTAGGGSSSGKCTSMSCLTPMTAQVDEYGQHTSCAYKGAISVTYDDGPHEQYTAPILDELLARGIKTTFFIVGSQLETAINVALLQREYKEGHQIATHTYTHPDLATLTNAQIASEISKTEAAIFAAIGVAPKYMRCPYGSITATGAQYIQSLGLKMVYWNLDTNDWLYLNETLSYAEYTKVLTSATVAASTSIISLQHDIQLVTMNMVKTTHDFVASVGMVESTVANCLGDTNLYYTTLPTRA
ncbi:hypothetical protein GGF31_004246 [Allomyces arbusculus]|nr:hypothetical protein GGF31_004246 [Allomyces arbusculus]